MRLSPGIRRAAMAGLLGVVVSPLLVACGGDGRADGDGPSVVAAFYPLAFVAERVAGDLADVENLTTPGGEPHDLELGVSQTVRLLGADVVVLESGFQPAVDDAADAVDGVVVDAAEVVELRVATHHEDEHGDDSEHGDRDPHFWLDPLLLADLGDAVAGALSDADPDHAADYAANAAALRRDLETLDAEYSQGLRGCQRTIVVVSHDAFEYLTRYGLEFEPIAGLTPDAEPTPAGLARLQDVARAQGITTVFSERLASPALAETLASDLGLETAVLDPIEGLGDDTGDQDYLSLMRANLAALQEANGC